MDNFNINDINIDDFINIINNNNKIKGEKCMVCHMNDSIDNMILLDCKHYFHTECIKLGKKKSINCIYCGKKTIFKKQLIIKHKPVKKKLKTKTNLCKTILKSGARKGMECGRINCGYHKNKDIII